MLTTNEPAKLPCVLLRSLKPTNLTHKISYVCLLVSGLRQAQSTKCGLL